MHRAIRPSARFGLLLLASLSGCSSQLDLGHDLKASVTGPRNTPNTTNTPDMPDASDAPDASNLPSPRTIPTAPNSPTSSTCVGIPCFAGPVLDLATSDGSAKGLVMDADNVFWAATAGQALMVTPKDGSVTTAISTPMAGPFRIDEDETNVYFTSAAGGYVATAPKSNRPKLGPRVPPPITLLVSGEPEPESLVVASEGIYFSDNTAGTVKRAALDGSTAETLVTGLSSGSELALDADSLYYVDSAVGDIYSIDRASKKIALLASGLNRPVAPVASGDALYFLELGTFAQGYADGRFSRMPRTGGPVEVLIDHLDSPTGLAADTAAFYVCTRGTELNGYRGKIVRLANDGQISTLAIDQAEPFAIAVDGTGVYWTTDADNGLHSIQR